MKPIYKILILVLIILLVITGGYFAWKKFTAGNGSGAGNGNEILPTLPVDENGKPLPTSPENGG